MDVSVPHHQEVPRSKNNEYHIKIKKARGNIFLPQKNFSREEREGPLKKEER